MTTESTQLQTELDELENQRTRLDKEVTDATAALDNARAELAISVGKKQIDAVAVLQARQMALAGARESVATRIVTKESRLSEALDEEGRQATLDELARTAAAATSDLREYERLREEAAAALRTLSDRLVDKFSNIIEHRQSFISLGSRLADLRFHDFLAGGYGKADAEQTKAARELLRELEDSGADLTAVRHPSDGRLSLIDRDYAMPSVEPFEQVLEAAFLVAVAERTRQARAAAA